MPEPLDLIHLRTLVAIVDCGGFHRAAAALRLSQSTVSQHVRLLEVGDGGAAKEAVVDLATEACFDAVDAGPLANAGYTEPAIELLVHLAYGQGLGAGIAWALTRG